MKLDPDLLVWCQDVVDGRLDIEDQGFLILPLSSRDLWQEHKLQLVGTKGITRQQGLELCLILVTLADK